MGGVARRRDPRAGNDRAPVERRSRGTARENMVVEVKRRRRRNCCVGKRPNRTNHELDTPVGKVSRTTQHPRSLLGGNQPRGI